MPAGRPVTYTPEVVEKAWDYVENHKEDHGDTVPSVAGLCRAINRARSTVYKWRDEEDKEISDILDALLEKQEVDLINGGLGNTFNSSIAKMMMTKHGYSDRIENIVDARVRPFENLTDEQLDQEIEELQNGD